MSGSSLTFDTALDLYQHRHRPTVLASFAEHLSVAHLAEAVVGRDRRATPTEVADSRSERPRNP